MELCLVSSLSLTGQIQVTTPLFLFHLRELTSSYTFLYVSLSGNSYGTNFLISYQWLMLQTTQITGSGRHLNLSFPIRWQLHLERQIRKGTGNTRDPEETRGLTFPEREVGNGEDRRLREGKRSSSRDESGKSLKQNKPQGGIAAGQECSPVRSD